jgi:hypothetical protein
MMKCPQTFSDAEYNFCVRNMYAKQLNLLAFPHEYSFQAGREYKDISLLFEKLPASHMYNHYYLHNPYQFRIHYRLHCLNRIYSALNYRTKRKPL